jgi:hypothetical protein
MEKNVRPVTNLLWCITTDASLVSTVGMDDAANPESLITLTV